VDAAADAASSLLNQERSMPLSMRAFELGRGKENLQPMEGLRGFAVFLVFLVHYITESRVTGTFYDGVRTIGHAGVDLFFILSGYLIYGNLIDKRQPFSRFMARRLRRLYPAFAVVFVLYVALSFAMPALSKIPSDSAWSTWSYLAINFFMLPGILPIDPMITVAWSLSYELLYYLVSPLVIGLLDLRARSRAWRVTFFVAATAALMAWCFFNGGHARLAMFIAGILLYEVRTAPRDSIASWAVVGALSILLFEAEDYAGETLRVVGLFVGLGALCAACFARPGGALGQTFSWSPMRWLGNMSYSYYLVHGLALKGAFMVLGVGPFWPMLPVMFALSLVPAALLFLAVEKPLSLGARRTPDPRRIGPGG
jgi:exopolysaccharide production protein ExoZ